MTLVYAATYILGRMISFKLTLIIINSTLLSPGHSKRNKIRETTKFIAKIELLDFY